MQDLLMLNKKRSNGKFVRKNLINQPSLFKCKIGFKVLKIIKKGVLAIIFSNSFILAG